MLDFKLYAITPYELKADLLRYATEAVAHGLKALRLRAEMREYEGCAYDLRAVIPHGKYFITPPLADEDTIRETAEFAKQNVEADGIHLPERAIDNLWMRKRIKDSYDGMVGFSVHSAESARRAERLGADFVTFGPVFENPVKRAMGFEAQGLEALSRAVQAVSIPVFAIGGITLAHAPACIQVGAWGVAVIRDLYEAPNIEERLMKYRKVLGTL